MNYHSEKTLDNIINYQLDNDIFSNTVQYYLTDMEGKYEYVNKIIPLFLKKLFGKEFKPIYLLSYTPNKYYKKDNYIVLNYDLKKEHAEKKIELLDSEELNEEFSKSIFIKELISKLGKKQDLIFIYNFTSSFLKITHPKIKIIGPDPKVATAYDSKLTQYRLFKKLKLPTVKSKFYKRLSELINNPHLNYPFYISANYSSGGFESMIINNNNDLLKFNSKISSINKTGPIIASELINNIAISPNVNALIDNKNEIKILNITDQLLNGSRYLGNIYPSKINNKQKNIIENSIIKIGKQLAQSGFKGVFGCDFIINKDGNVYIVDLNPRRQGGHIMLCLINNNLIKAEIEIALKRKIANYKSLNFDCDFAWAHSKIFPLNNNKNIIRKEFKKNTETLPFTKIGSSFSSSFYLKGFSISEGSLGYCITTGTKYEEVLKKITIETTNIIHEILNEENEN